MAKQELDPHIEPHKQGYDTSTLQILESVDLGDISKWRMAKRLLGTVKKPSTLIDEMSQETGLYKREEEDLKRLVDSTSYLPDNERQKALKAIHVALQVHQDHFRDSGDPYSTHLMFVAQKMTEYRQDAVNVAAAILHDSVEDRNLSLGFIGTQIDTDQRKEVAKTVESLSKIKSKRLNKLETAERYNEALIDAFSTNPRGMIIKIEDRLHNIVTIGTKSGQKLRTVEETLEIFAPFARNMGMFDEADAMEMYALRVLLGEDYEEVEEAINQEISENFVDFSSVPLVEEMNSLTGLNAVLVNVSMPTVYDAYRRSRGDDREYVSARDVYPKVYLPLEFPDQFSNQDLIEGVLRTITRVASNGDYEILENFDLLDFVSRVNEGLSRSATLLVKNRQTGFMTRLNILPANILSHRNTSLTDLYYVNTENPELQAEKRVDALEKFDYIKERLALAEKLGLGAGLTSGILESNVPKNILRVKGIDKNGRKETALVMRGDTLSDYARAIFPNSYWMNVEKYEVNGEEVGSDYKIEGGEEIHLTLGNRQIIHPVSIHSFHRDRIGPLLLKKRLMNILEHSYGSVAQERHLENKKRLLRSLEDTGQWVLDTAAGERLLGDLSTYEREVVNLVTKMEKSDYGAQFKKIHNHGNPESWKVRFLWAVGLGLIDRKDYMPIVEGMKQKNNSIIRYVVTFQESQSGQMLGALRAFMEKVNIRLSTGESNIANGIARVTVYHEPAGEHDREEILSDIDRFFTEDQLEDVSDRTSLAVKSERNGDRELKNAKTRMYIGTDVSVGQHVPVTQTALNLFRM